jgi:hypothetical protein
VENLFQFSRVLAFTLIHIQSYQGETGDLPNMKRALAASPDQTAEDSVQLGNGMTAGILYSLYEIGELADYPSDILLQSPPLLQNSNDDVLRIK